MRVGTMGMSEQRVVGPIGCRKIGLSEQWGVGIVDDTVLVKIVKDILI